MFSKYYASWPSRFPDPDRSGGQGARWGHLRLSTTTTARLCVACGVRINPVPVQPLTTSINSADNTTLMTMEPSNRTGSRRRRTRGPPSGAMVRGRVPIPPPMGGGIQDASSWSCRPTTARTRSAVPVEQARRLHAWATLITEAPPSPSRRRVMTMGGEGGSCRVHGRVGESGVVASCSTERLARWPC